MKLSGKPATELPLPAQAYIIAQSHNKGYRFSAKQKWGIALLFFMIAGCCFYMYLISKEISVFGILALFIMLLAVAFRQVLKSKPYFSAIADKNILILTFDLSRTNDTLERHRIMVPVQSIIGYDTRSFLKGNISHVSIRFRENNQTITTRPIIVEALSKEELNKLLLYLDAQVSHARRLNGINTNTLM